MRVRGSKRMGNLSLGFWVTAFFLLGSLIDSADGSIHEYKDEGFVKIANGRYFYGGAEGLYASEFLGVDASSATTPPLKGNSFIRYVFQFSLLIMFPLS